MLGKQPQPDPQEPAEQTAPGLEGGTLLSHSVSVSQSPLPTKLSIVPASGGKTQGPDSLQRSKQEGQLREGKRTEANAGPARSLAQPQFPHL